MRDDRMVSEVLGSETVLTPSDLYNRSFRRALIGGYQAQDVDVFLERVADVLESLIQQVRSLKGQIEEYKVKLDEYRQIEETLRNALVTSQKFGENLIESAKREAGAILESARAERSRVGSEAARLPAALTQEIARLREQRNRLRSEMMAIVTAHRAMLDNMAPAEESLQASPLFTSREDAGDTGLDLGAEAGKGRDTDMEDET